jgi:hypothetical protein
LIIVLSILILACAETQESGGDAGPWSNASVTRTKGMVHKYFSAKVNVSSNYIDKVRYNETIEGTLPPGITWNSSRGVFEGTPTLAGFYTVKVYYRDAIKGTHNDPDSANDQWYYYEFELAMYDELEDTG